MPEDPPDDPPEDPPDDPPDDLPDDGALSDEVVELDPVEPDDSFELLDEPEESLDEPAPESVEPAGIVADFFEDRLSVL